MSRVSKNHGLVCFYEPRTPSGIICRTRISLNLPLWHLHPRFACNKIPNPGKRWWRILRETCCWSYIIPGSLYLLSSLLSVLRCWLEIYPENRKTLFYESSFQSKLGFICRKIARLASLLFADKTRQYTLTFASKAYILGQSINTLPLSPNNWKI